MRKAFILLLTILLLIPQAYAVEEDATALRFGTAETVYSIYASYEVEEGVTELTVTFAESVKNYAYSNVVNGKLWISIASVNPIDLTKPIGWVTGKNTAGQAAAPTLELASLQFNGEAAKGNLVVESVEAVLREDTLQVSAAANDAFMSSYTLVAAAYGADGKLLGCAVKAAAFEEKRETFEVALANAEAASSVKVFFLSSEWKPVAMAEDLEIGT